MVCEARHLSGSLKPNIRLQVSWIVLTSGNIVFVCAAVEMKATLMAATFMIDYLHFEADPGDSDDEED